MVWPVHDSNPRRYIRRPYVNLTLIVVTCAVFMFETLLPGGALDALIVRLAVIPAMLTGSIPQPLAWLPPEATLVTYAFLHANWLHLLPNMLFLWIFGDNIEDALGHWKYLAFYLACAALAAIVHTNVDNTSITPLIGASGAVAGVMGAYVLLYPHARLIVLATIVIPIPLPVPAFWMLGFWIATQLFYALVGSPEPVAWWAHIGGAAAGVVLGALMKRRSVPLFGSG